MLLVLISVLVIFNPIFNLAYSLQFNAVVYTPVYNCNSVQLCSEDNTYNNCLVVHSKASLFSLPYNKN